MHIVTYAALVTETEVIARTSEGGLNPPSFNSTPPTYGSPPTSRDHQPPQLFGFFSIATGPLSPNTQFFVLGTLQTIRKVSVLEEH